MISMSEYQHTTRSLHSSYDSISDSECSYDSGNYDELDRTENIILQDVAVLNDLDCIEANSPVHTPCVNWMLLMLIESEEIEKSIRIESIAEYLEINSKMQDIDTNVPHPVFSAKKIATISVLDYLKRIQKFTDCSNSTFLLALIYIDRVQEYSGGEPLLNSYTLFRLILVASVVAMKYNCDVTCKNDYYARVGGVKMDELNSIESTFCEMIDFDFYVSDATFALYREEFRRL